MSKRHRKCSDASKTAINSIPAAIVKIPVSKNAIGVFGGIFDPLHNGHLAVASLAREHFSLERIFFIPSGRPPHKSMTCAAAADRLAMLRLAIGHDPSFTIWDEEIRRNRISYTFDSLKKLRRDFPGTELYFIIGSDNLPEIETWYRYEDILKMVTLCVAHRPGHSMRNSRLPTFTRVCPIPSPEWGISSTLVRKYLACGYSCDHLIPEKVAGYIKRNRLYQKLGR